MSDFITALPEIFLLSMVCVVLTVDLFLKDSQRNITYLLSQVSLGLTLLLTLAYQPESAQLAFNGTFISDLMSVVLKCFVFVITAVAFLYSRSYLQDRGMFRGEYYVLGLFGVLGMMIMISAYSMLSLYLGLELMSLSMYAMVAFCRDSKRASEAAMKYFVLGALASGMLLYGMSIIYGMTGSLNIIEISNSIGESGSSMGLLLGLAFIVVGLAFKFGAVPFHMWIPDVYHGAPTAVTLYIATAPKIAAFAMTMRLLVEGLGGLQADWQTMLIVLSVLSLALGNIVAIAQSSIKRMLAYSTISHVGFLLLGILAGTGEGYAASMFYAVTYGLTSLGGFGMILFLSRKGFEAEELDDFKGLNERSPWFAFMMLIILFSMAGIPPTVGFYAKLSVLTAIVNVDLIWLATVAVIFSVIGAYYYLRAVKMMYFDKAEDSSELQSCLTFRFALSANGLTVLALGIFPAGLMALCAAALNV